MKLGIVTRSETAGAFYKMSLMTHPIIKDYAKRIGADFIVIDGRYSSPVNADPKSHAWYRIVHMRDMLTEKYDRLLYMDTDIVINPNCPNIFDEVPEDSIGFVLDGRDTRPFGRDDIWKYVENINKAWGDLGWRKTYTCGGVIVVSRMHCDIFLPHNGQYYLGWGHDDLHCGYNAHKLGFKIHELDTKWNFMSVFSYPPETRTQRDVNFVHWAGGGWFYNRPKDPKLHLIATYIKEVYGNKYKVT